MRNTLSGVLLLTAAAFAHAAGPYDAIYQSTQVDTTYVAVHQNGGNVITAIYDSMPSSGVRMNTPNGSIVPTKQDYWEVLSGPIVGNMATVSGQRNFGGCLQTYNVVFTGTGATATLTATEPTPAGLATGLNCSAATPVGTILQFIKVW